MNELQVFKDRVQSCAWGVAVAVQHTCGALDSSAGFPPGTASRELLHCPAPRNSLNCMRCASPEQHACLHVPTCHCLSPCCMTVHCCLYIKGNVASSCARCVPRCTLVSLSLSLAGEQGGNRGAGPLCGGGYDGLPDG